MTHKWPLNTNDFNLLDRLKICGFFLNYENRWTQSRLVQEYENKIAHYVGAKYAVFVSSGSTANQLIAQYTKDNLIQRGEWPKRNKVIINAVTWQTNLSPFIREGFEPIFIDANLSDFSLDYDSLDKTLELHKNEVACVFPTSVLGFTPDINRINSICLKHNVPLKLDNCENSEGRYLKDGSWRNICSEFTCSTSVYVAHIWSNGTEGGFIFTNLKEEYEYYLMARAHGLLRNLFPYSAELGKTESEILKSRNELVDSQFDFQILSSNYRSTDFAAFCGLLNFEKLLAHRLKRKALYKTFFDKIDKTKYILPPRLNYLEDVPFCLPIVLKNPDTRAIESIKRTLDISSIERRSFISGNMLRQKCYQKYGNYLDFPNAEIINNFGLYVGLYPSLKEKYIVDLVEKLNNI